MAKLVKWVGAQVLVGVVVAAAVSLSTVLVENARAYEMENRQLQNVQIGLNKRYIDSNLGPAMVEFWERDADREMLLNAYYTLEHASVRCVYAKDEVVAFFITVKGEKPFFTPKLQPDVDSRQKAIGGFPYAALSVSDRIEGNVPANNEAYRYYSETTYGAGPADYCYFVYASYVDRQQDNRLPLYGQARACGSGEEFYPIPSPEYDALRAHVRPNTFGMIHGGYADLIQVIPYSGNLRNYCRALFY